jgi:ribose-phosphate pyrophosphokinase
MISTATSITEAARACRKHGAKDIFICATHAVLSGKAVEKLAKAPIKEVVVTDTIPVVGKEFPTLKVLSIATLLGEAIRRIHHSESVSSLFL